MTTLLNPWKTYKPLIIILVFCGILASLHTEVMSAFMGYFLVFLSLFKFFDINSFVDGFAAYDLITRKVRVYGYVYPFIELLLGLAYLAEINPSLINSITVVVMTISGIGVLKGIASGRDLKCACLGTALEIPLSIVSVVESVGMGLMAAYKLL
jgi:hypothetical protein